MPIITTIRGNLRPTGRSLRSISATGGIISDITWNGVSYRVHRFNTDGSFVVSDAGTNQTMEVILVGGGGSGGVDNGSGGGAGGLIDTIITPANTTYNIVIGAGGQSRIGSQDDGPGYSGFNTTGFGLTALGGAGGTGWVNSGTPIGGSSPGTLNGGSGSGQSASSGSTNGQGRGLGLQPTSSSGGFGNNGGTAVPSFSGGGGGAGGAGGNGSGSQGSSGKAGDGGEGYFLNGRFGSGIGVSDYLAGGGAGGFDYATGARSSAVFTRNGTTKQLTETGESNCPANTGAGGNGANHDNENSGAGGSGIVLVRYRINI